MDTDLLELGSDNAAADNDDPYSKATGIVRHPVLASACTATPSSKPGATADKVEPITTTLPAQPTISHSSAMATLPWPDPPAMHSVSVHSEHYKSPGLSNDGVLGATANRPAPELVPKSTSVPAIPPRKPRLETPNVVAGRSETAIKATQVQPPLPHIRKSTTDSKTTTDSFINRMYGVAVVEKPPQRVVEVNGNPPPAPVPRNIASANSLQTLVPSSNTTAVSSDGSFSVPCETLSSDEQVCEQLIIEL